MPRRNTPGATEGKAGPIIPVHTRNDVENIALCGEEDFLRFSWWRRYRDFGKVNELAAFQRGAHRRLRERPYLGLAGGRRPDLCRGHLSAGAHRRRPGRQPLPDRRRRRPEPGDGGFYYRDGPQAGALTAGARLISKMATGGSGFEVCLGPSGAVQVVVADASGASVRTPSPGLSLDTVNYHYVAVAGDRDGELTFCVDGTLGTCGAARPGSLDNGEAFTVGRRAKRGVGFFPGPDRPDPGAPGPGVKRRRTPRQLADHPGPGERFGLSGSRRRPGSILGLPAPGGIFLPDQ